MGCSIFEFLIRNKIFGVKNVNWLFIFFHRTDLYYKALEVTNVS